MQIMQIFGLPTWQEAVRGILVFICQFLYKFIAWIYELFITVARVNILSSEKMTPIYNRVTMILTIVMVFYITFEFVKYVVQPDTISDKEKGVGNMAFKIIFVILLIAFVPRIFSMAYELQGKIIDNQILPKVILGKKNINMSTYGRGFSADILSVFYKVNEEVCKECDAEAVVNFNLNRLRQEGDLKYLDIGINDTVKSPNPANGKEEETTVIDFDGLPAVIIGGAIVYILALYSIDVGTRYAQLIFLQIISPIAIMGYLTPKKDNMFSKWVKQCMTTYINLFIRIAIIYFVLLICQELGDSYRDETLFAGLGTISKSIHAFAYIALVMGLLVFANKAPKMLQELFPSMSGGAAGIGFGLGAKERGLDRLFGATIGTAAGAVAGATSGIRQGMRGFRSGGNLAKRIASGITNGTLGAAGGLVGGTVRGFAGGVKKGNPLKNGFTGAKNQMKANKRFGNKAENDYYIWKEAQDKLGIHSRQETAESNKAKAQRHKTVLDEIAKTNDDMRTRAEKKIFEGKGGEKGQMFLIKDKIARDFKEDPSVRAQYTVDKYGTQEAADKAFQADYQQALEDAKKAKDIAINSYIDNVPDDAIKNMKSTLKVKIDQHNQYNRDNKIDNTFIDTKDAEELDNYVKKDIQDLQNKDEETIIKQDAKIEAIKRETAGSTNK